MSAESEGPKPRKPKVRWLILGAAVAFAALACAAALVVLILYRSNTALFVGTLAVAAVSLEVLFWTAAGVFGWGFLAKRRATLERWRERFFGKRAESDEAP